MAKGGGARKYVRDNRGRFAAVGATARGGRLKTAGGSRRATQTRKIQGRPGNTISKPRGLQPGAIKPKPARRTSATSRLRPGELMNANARPVNTMARFRKGENPWHRFAGKNHAEHNLGVAENWVRSQGISSNTYSNRKKNGSNIAMAWQSSKTIGFNKASGYWSLPKSEQIRLRRSGWHSSSSPTAVLHHEMGHIKDRRLAFRWQEAINSSTSKAGRARRYNSFDGAAYVQLPAGQRKKRGQEIKALARRVSRYATTNPSEFIAETYAGLRTGRRYDSQVMRAYREAQGLSPRPAARRRSRLPKRGKS